MSAMEDERRPVTVLFADIVGSTGLGERLEPEQAKVLVDDVASQGEPRIFARAVAQADGVGHVATAG